MHCEGGKVGVRGLICWARDAAYWWVDAGIGVLADGCSVRGGKGRGPADLRMGSGLSVALGLRRGRGAAPRLARCSWQRRGWAGRAAQRLATWAGQCRWSRLLVVVSAVVCHGGVVRWRLRLELPSPRARMVRVGGAAVLGAGCRPSSVAVGGGSGPPSPGSRLKAWL